MNKQALRIIRKTAMVAGKDKAQELRDFEKPGDSPEFPGKLVYRLDVKGLVALHRCSVQPHKRILAATRKAKG